MNLDPVFIMFIVAMIILLSALLFITVNEKKDSELSIADIELYKRLDMIKDCNKSDINNDITNTNYYKNLKNKLSILEKDCAESIIKNNEVNK